MLFTMLPRLKVARLANLSLYHLSLNNLSSCNRTTVVCSRQFGCIFNRHVAQISRTLHKKEYSYLEQYRRIATSQCLLKKYISDLQKAKWSTMYYSGAFAIAFLGLAFGAVPLYKAFCRATSYGGTVKHDTDIDKLSTVKPVTDHRITIEFNADTSAMAWNFKPLQRSLDLAVGETALAFYSAYNPTDKPVIGISTYNVLPFDAGQYFNKIQCFCFDEQMLNPHEEVLVQMPVFFYIDPEFSEDPAMENVDTITLSYTFFEAKPGLEIPLPGFMQKM